MHWPRELTKGQKREVLRIIRIAHDRELAGALASLEEQFGLWRAGEIGPHEVSEAIHAFHQGPSRQLWLRYNDGADHLAVLGALQRGVIAEHEIATDVLALLKPLLAKDGR